MPGNDEAEKLKKVLKQQGDRLARELGALDSELEVLCEDLAKAEQSPSGKLVQAAIDSCAEAIGALKSPSAIAKNLQDQAKKLANLSGA